MNVKLALVFKEVYFKELIHACKEHLMSQGFSVSVYDNVPSPHDFDSILVIGIHLFTKIPFSNKVPILGVQTEQLPMGGIGKGRLHRNFLRYRAVRGFYSLIFEWNPSLFSAGFGDVFLPYGCNPTILQNSKKKWDVVFIGNVGGSQRRLECLDFLSSKFDLYPDFSPGFSDRKVAAIQESKICLNIHYYDDCGFESPRVFDYLSKGGFVLSERTNSTRPFVVGTDLDDFGDNQELAEKIDYYLTHENERAKISLNGYRTACNYDYMNTAKVIGKEVVTILNSGQSTTPAFLRWFAAYLRCCYMDFRDFISINRRRLLKQFAK